VLLIFFSCSLSFRPIQLFVGGGVGGWCSAFRVCVCVCVCTLSRFSCAQLFAALWTVVHQVPWSMGFSRQEYCSGLPCPPPGDRPNPGVEPTSLTSPSLAGRFFTTSATYIPCWVTSVVSDSVPPHRWQPTRLCRPWDSPGKTTGVGCHCLLNSRWNLSSKLKVFSQSVPSSTWCYVMTKGVGWGWEGGSREKGFMYTCDWSTLFHSRN